MDLGALLSNIGVLAVLLMLSGFFSGSETALSSLTKLDLERLRRDQKSKTSKSILGFTDNPRRLFNTILLGNTFINTAFATITASLVAIVAGGAHSPTGLIVVTLVITVLVVSGRVLECDGRTELDELRDHHRLLLPAGNYETTAGLVLEARGNVPLTGDSVRVGRYTITVLDADLRTIKKVRIKSDRA